MDQHTRPSTFRMLMVALGITTLFLTACGSDDTSSDPATTVGPTTTGGPTTTPPPTKTTIVGTVVGEAEEPIVLLPRNGDDGHLWLAERGGVVRVMSVAPTGELTSGDVVLDISDEVKAGGEQGLLGMAFSPDGSTLFVSYTNTDGNSRVDRYAMDGDEADPSSKRQIFAVDQPYPNHNGGDIVFGPDDELYLGLGDGGAGDDPDNRAQDDSTPLGKLLRLDRDGGEPTIVAKGLRNPWRFAFDSDDSLWVADVGQQEWEEINHVAAEQIEGANFGWSGYEGTHPYLDGDGRRPDDPVMPVHEYDHSDGRCSITGGFPYRGSALPELDGAFLFADYCDGRVHAVKPASTTGGDTSVIDLDITVENPFSFGVDQQGEPFVLSASGQIVALRPGS